VELARQQVRTKPVQVKFEPDASLPQVDHDPALIQHVVLNLILNGIQAISGEGEVRVNVQRAGETAIVQVCDTGRGISAAALPRIFKPFFTTRSDGTGLGLSLANSIVQSHGGHIDVTSRPGAGSQFKVSLPLQHLAKPL
jgi:two-component system, NtrC family, sensor kinase